MWSASEIIEPAMSMTKVTSRMLSSPKNDCVRFLSGFNAKPFMQNQEFNADKQQARLEISAENRWGIKL